MVAERTYKLTVVQVIVIVNIGIFLLQLNSSFGHYLLKLFALWPLGLENSYTNLTAAPQFHLWQLISYSFLHGSIPHLLLNMYALWLFGSRMESIWGYRNFTIYYFVCVIGAGIVQLFVAGYAIDHGNIYPTIGASGGVFGLLLAFAMVFPNEKLMLVFPPIILKAKWFVLIYGGIELWAGVTGTMAGIAHFAHLGGMLFGYILLRYWRYQSMNR